MFALVGITFAQVYVPTGVSTQSGIIRNVPTTYVRIPASTYITDGRQTYLAAQVPLQLVNTNFNDNNQNRQNNQNQILNLREDNILRLIESENRLRQLLQQQENNDNNNRWNQNWLNAINENNNYDNNNNQNNQNNNQNNNNQNNRANSKNNQNSYQSTTLNSNQLRALVSSNNRDNLDGIQQYRESSDSIGLSRLRDASLLSRN